MFVLAAVAAYSSAIKAPFEFDDLPAIQQNRTIRGLSLDALAPPAQTAVAGRPVVNITLAVNYAINDALGVDQRTDPDGPNKTIGYHVVNLLFHLACGLVLFGVIRRTVARLSGDGSAAYAEQVAGVTVLLWLVHPMQTEAVDYVIQRTELIVSLCYAATLYGSLRAWDSANLPTRRRWYAVAVCVCALGMASKEIMITAPIVVLLYDRCIRATSWSDMWGDRERRWFYLLLFASGCFVLISVVTHARSQSVGFHLGVTWYQYFYTQAWAITRYLRLLLWPSGLNFDYGERPVSVARALPGLALLGMCAGGALYAMTRPRWRWLGFVGVAFFLVLAPSSSVVPIKTEIAADRRIYLASVVVFVLIVLGVERLLRRYRWNAMVDRALVAAAALALAATSYERGLTYRSQESLYGDVIAKAPDNPRGYVGVGLAYVAKGPGAFDDARRMFILATRVDSTSAIAWQSLALVDMLNGRWATAVESYSRVLRIDSTNVNATDGMARALLERSETDAAIPYVERMGAADLDLLWSLGEQLVDEGRGSAALRYLEVAANRETPAAEHLAELSEAYAQSGRIEEAEAAAAVATASAGDTASVFVRSGRAMLTAHDTVEARSYFQRALALDSTLAQAKLALDSIKPKL